MSGDKINAHRDEATDAVHSPSIAEGVHFKQDQGEIDVPADSFARDSIADKEFDSQLRAARGGCRETQGRILESLRTYLMMMARSRFRDGDLSHMNPSDLVQSCNLNAIGSFQDFQGTTKQELQAWLKTILVNNLSTQRRQRQRPILQTRLDQTAWESLLRRMGEAHTDDSTPSSIVIRGERDIQLREILSTLPERYQQIITLRQFQKLSFPEIAARMGCSSNAACHTWMRALEDLGKKVGSRSEW